MVNPGWNVLGRLFVQELLAQTHTGEATALTVADSIDMDEAESANLMGWLAGERLVSEVDNPDAPYCDPYTTRPIAATPRGRAFAESGVMPEGPAWGGRTWGSGKHMVSGRWTARLRAADDQLYGPTSATPTATSDRTAGPMATSSP